MIWILFVILLTAIALGAPVLLAIGAAGFIGLALNDLNPAFMPQRMFAMLDSFSLLALPYFILAGELMTRGGLSEKLVRFAELLVGHIRGGLGLAAVLANIVFANVSGSSTAATVAIGSILIPAMKQRGYPAGFAAALIAASGIIGPIIPPSMTMIVYGSMAGVSIGKLFLSGIAPGLLIGLALTALIVGFSYMPGFEALRGRSERANWGQIKSLLKDVWVALLAPVIIIGGILGGIFTATEAGAVTCLYALIVSMAVYRTVRWKDLPAILVEAAMTTAVVVGIIAVAGGLGWLLAYLDFNGLALRAITSISRQPLAVMMLLIGLMLLMTMFIESLAVLVILIPVITYISKTFGFDPVHTGLLMVFATQIGAVTPPVAVLLFVSTSIAKTSYDQTLRYCWPFVAVLIAVLLFCLLFPMIVVWIPNTFLR